MDGRGQQRFAAEGRVAQKLIKQLMKLAKRGSSQDDLEIQDTLTRLYDADSNLSQSLIYSIEKLLSSEKNTDAAQRLFLYTTRLLQRNDVKQCLDFVYSCHPLAINQSSLEVVFHVHFHEQHNLASLIILDGLVQDEWALEKRKEIAKRMKGEVTTKTDIIYQNLANLLLLKQAKAGNESLLKHPKTGFLESLAKTPLIAWEYRNQLSRMIRRDLNVKYQKSILGWVWGIVEPLALTITFLFLFDILSTVTSQYMPLNIMIGIIIWSGFGNILLRGTKSLEGNAAILQRVALPRQIFILNIAGTAIVTISLNILAIVPLLIYYQIVPSWKLLLFPVALVMVTTYAVSVSLFTATIQAKWRDVSHFVSVAVRIGFYFTPVFFTLDMLINGRIPPEFVTAYLILNPMAIYLTIARSAFTNEHLDIGNEFLLISIVHLMILYSISSFWFCRTEDRAVKYL